MTSPWRSGRSWLIAGVLTGVIVVGYLLFVAVASATGVNPDPPNPSSPQARAALAAAVNGQNAYAETFTFSQGVTLLSTSCGAGCFALTNGYANVTNASSSLPAGSSLFTETETAGGVHCPSGCPPWTQTCDGHTIPVGPQRAVCNTLLMVFGGAHVAQLPSYSISRLEGWTIPQGQTWFGSATGASMSSQVESWPAGIFGNLATLGLTSYLVTEISWAVPLPSGSFNAAATTIQFLNTSTMLSSSQFSQQATWILLQWNSPPTSACVNIAMCQQPTSHAVVLQYQFALTFSQKPPNGGGGVLPPNNGTQATHPSVPIAGYTFSTAISLPLANVSLVNGNNYSARVFWHNPYPYSVPGPFAVSSSVFLSSGGFSISANGTPVPSTQYGTSNTTLLIYPGAVTVPSGANLALVIAFHFNLSFNPTATLWVINGVHLTSGVILGGFALGAGGLVSIAEFNSPRLQRVRFIGTAEGLILLTGLVIVWLGAL